VSECDTVVAQFAHVPTLRGAILQRAKLQKELEAAEAAGDDFVLVGTLGERLEAQCLRIAEQPLSEEDYLTLADRHEALVLKTAAICRELAKSKAYADVKMLGAKLQDLKALDVSALPQSWSNDPVQPPAPPAPGVTAEEEEEEWAYDPVYVPPTPVFCQQNTVPPAYAAASVSTEEGEDDGANDPVYVPPDAGEITLA
jgi:hypothetical protein